MPSRAESIEDFFKVVAGVSRLEITQAIVVLQRRMNQIQDIMGRIAEKQRYRLPEVGMVLRMIE